MIHDPIKLVVVNLLLSSILAASIFVWKYIFKKENNLLVLLIVISLLPVVSIARAGTYEAGDLTLHSVFLQSFYENLTDGILLPQWAGGLCAGRGCPVFIFEYLTPFYLGSFFHLLGFSYLNSMKLFLASAYILSGISMYAFLREEVNEKAAFVGALLYLFAPVHLIEMHFRVSVGTHAAFVFIPLAFLFAKKALSGRIMYILLNAVNFVLLLLSHSSIAFVSIPLACFYALLKREPQSKSISLFVSYLLGCGLSAYYLLPAALEIQHTWYYQSIKMDIDFKPFFDYIFSPARYGFLFQGNHGELRVIVGYIHLFIIGYAIYVLSQHRFQKNRLLILFLLSTFFVCFILMQEFTKPLWENIFFLTSFILPWRLLVPISFVTAFLGAIFIQYQPKPVVILFCLLIIYSTVLNWGNRKMIPEDRNAYFTHWSLYTEYFEPNDPLYVKRWDERDHDLPNVIRDRPKSHLEILSGNGEVREIFRNQIKHEYLVYAISPLVVSENTFYFPGWRVITNGKNTPIDIKNETRFGTLVFTVPPGLHHIRAEFQDTFIRYVGKFISLLCLIISLLLLSIFFFKRMYSSVIKADSYFFHKRR